MTEQISTRLDEKSQSLVTTRSVGLDRASVQRFTYEIVTLKFQVD